LTFVLGSWLQPADFAAAAIGITGGGKKDGLGPVCWCDDL